MLPYGVKVAWIVLCTMGAATCWPVLWALAKAVNNWWAPMTYAAALTAMVLVFDIGMSTFYIRGGSLNRFVLSRFGLGVGSFQDVRSCLPDPNGARDIFR